MSVAIVIPAAGASSRMRGADKLMQLIDGEPLLRRVAKRAAEVSEQVVVTIPVGSDRRAALRGLKVKIIDVPFAAKGMSESLKLGVSAIRAATGIMVLPADMPDIDDQDLWTMIDAFLQNRRAIRGGTKDNTAGHPVIFPIEFQDKFQSLSGDQGARTLLKDVATEIVTLPNAHAITDLDTPEAWAKWHAER